MGYRTTLWMAVILLALAGYLVWVEIPQQREKEAADQASKILLSIDGDTIRTIRVKTHDQETDLKKTGDNQWSITSPLPVEADASEVKNLIATFSDLRFTRVIEETNPDPAQYGFDHPVVEITVGLPDSEEKVIVGDDGPVANTLYVKQGSTQRVVLAEEWIKGSLNRSFFDLRNKTVDTIDAEKATALRVNFPEKTFVFKKDGEGWKVESPRSAGADGNRIDGLLRSLANLRATAFTDSEAEKKAARSKFKKEILSVEVAQGDLQTELAFYPAETKGNAFTVTSPEKPIYTVSDSLLGDFKPDLFAYLDKHLLKFKKEDVARMEIKTASESYVLSKAEGGWSLEGESARPEEEDVDNFLSRLENLSARREPDPPVKPDSAAIEPPTTEVRLLDSNHRVLAAVGIGSEFKDMLLAKGNSDLGVVLVDKNVLDDIPRKNELVKETAAGKQPGPNTTPPSTKK
jgi:Domain of unknown function (DUF4340)